MIGNHVSLRDCVAMAIAPYPLPLRCRAQPVPRPPATGVQVRDIPPRLRFTVVERWLRGWGWAGALGIAIAWGPLGPTAAVASNAHALSLNRGFTPNPTILRGDGGGDYPAADVVGVSSTPTGPCLGYIDRAPHERLTLEARFDNLELRVNSNLDTTLIVAGPGGVWCNDDSDGHNPAIAGEWLPGDYRIWIGAYRADETPTYRLFIEDLAR